MRSHKRARSSTFLIQKLDVALEASETDIQVLVTCTKYMHSLNEDLCQTKNARDKVSTRGAVTKMHVMELLEDMISYEIIIDFT